MLDSVSHSSAVMDTSQISDKEMNEKDKASADSFKKLFDLKAENMSCYRLLYNLEVEISLNLMIYLYLKFI